MDVSDTWLSMVGIEVVILILLVRSRARLFVRGRCSASDLYVISNFFVFLCSGHVNLSTAYHHVITVSIMAELR